MRKLTRGMAAPVRRMLAGAAVLASLVLGVGVVAPGPALAAVGGGSATGLADAAGHTCKALKSFNSAGSTWQLTFCIELGIYTSAGGISSVVAQVEAVCSTSPPGGSLTCGGVDGYAAAYTPNIPGSESVATEFYCGGQPAVYCAGSATGGRRTYFEPLATTVGNTDLYIWPGTCVNNVWAVLWAGSWINLWGENGVPNNDIGTLTKNLGTAHYNVCMSSSGQVTWN
jgi:hypothetical protein